MDFKKIYQKEMKQFLKKRFITVNWTYDKIIKDLFDLNIVSENQFEYGSVDVEIYPFQTVFRFQIKNKMIWATFSYENEDKTNKYEIYDKDDDVDQIDNLLEKLNVDKEVIKNFYNDLTKLNIKRSEIIRKSKLNCKIDDCGKVDIGLTIQNKRFWFYYGRQND